MATMPSLLPATFALGFQPPKSRTQFLAIPIVLGTRSKLARFGHSSRNAGRSRVPTMFASNINPPPEGDKVKGKSNGGRMQVADGPPLPTIVAGVLVFLLICWIAGSIVMWLVGLIVNPPPQP